MAVIAPRVLRLHRRAFVRLTLTPVVLAASGAILSACGNAVAPTPPAPTPGTAGIAPTVGVAPTPAAATIPPTAAPTNAPTIPTTSAMPAMTAATAAATPVTAASFSPSPAPNVPDAYTTLPPSFKSVAMVPSKGGKITAFLIGYNPPVPPRTANRYWQELEKRLGATWEPTVTPAASYVEKLTGIVASGDVPDLTFL